MLRSTKLLRDGPHLFIALIPDKTRKSFTNVMKGSIFKNKPCECSTVTQEIYKGCTDTPIYVQDKVWLLLTTKKEKANDQ